MHVHDHVAAETRGRAGPPAAAQGSTRTTASRRAGYDGGVDDVYAAASNARGYVDRVSVATVAGGHAHAADDARRRDVVVVP